MKRLFIFTFCALAFLPAQAEDSHADMVQLADKYFATMVASQAPDATAKELESYLSLLSDDVGHQHLPYQTDDERSADGKDKMREGMNFYLGAHTKYKAELHNTFIFNESAIAIRYTHSAEGVHPESKQFISYTTTIMEVLEIENGQVAVIRKYHE